MLRGSLRQIQNCMFPTLRRLKNFLIMALRLGLQHKLIIIPLALNQLQLFLNN